MSYPQFQAASDYLGAIADEDYVKALPSNSYEDRRGAVLDGPEAGYKVTYTQADAEAVTAEDGRVILMDEHLADGMKAKCYCCSAWIFYLLGSVLFATAVLSFLMKQSQGMETLQMLIGGFVIFMIPQVVGSVAVFLELVAATIRQVWYI